MKHIIAVIWLGYFLSAAEAQKMESYFISMPNDYIVLLEEAWRKDLVDIYKSGKPAVLENTMQGKSVMNKLTDNYLLLQSSESSTVELKLLSLVNNTYIICMIETVYAPVADSRVTFYSTEWEQIASDNIFTPVGKDWFWKEDMDSSSPECWPQSELFLVKYSLSDENATLTAQYMTPLLFDEETQQLVKLSLKTEPKIYEWKSGRFE